MSTKKRGLGRGLDALLGSVAPAPAQAETGEELRELELELLAPGRHQPRRKFDPEALQSLADSIRSQGVVQPIVARPLPNGRFEIVAGERRWRAAKIAELKTIPTVVRQIPDRTAMAVALVENIQRADLNPLEEAQAYRELMDTFGLTQAEVARRVGRSRSAVANLVRLLNLPREIIEALHAGAIHEGHARALFVLDGRETQLAMLDQVISEGYSVRQTEEMVRRSKAGLPSEDELDAVVDGAGAPAAPAPRRTKARRSPADLETTALEDNFRSALKTKVQLSRSREGGRLVIHFYSEEMLEHLYHVLVGPGE
jgi:ParB family transcriptional regulator, chromosome partitioning protein